MMIGITDNFTTNALLSLQKSLDCTTERGAPKDAVGLLIRSRTIIDEKFLQLHPRLKVIVSATSGYDHIDANECKKRNIAAMYTPDANAQSAAELTIHLILSVLRRSPEVNKIMKAGAWKDELKLGSELHGKTVGIIGLGRVGSRVAKILNAFGTQVVAHDPYQKDEVFQTLGIARLGLIEVLVQSDILTLHVPLNDETRHVISHQTIKELPDNAYIINTSRGRVIDESALMAGLEAGEIAGAALDVFENEPLTKKSRLRDFPNVVLTPHIGAYTEEALEKASQEAVSHLTQFLLHGTVRDPVPNT